MRCEYLRSDMTDLVCLTMQGASQIRQSFSKRKRGIAQKAYQLHKITDAKASLFSA